MTTRRKWVACLFSAGLVLLTTAAYFWTRARGPAPAQIERCLRAEIPVGSDRETLIAWLKDNRLPTPSWVTPTGLPGITIPAGGCVTWVVLPGIAGYGKWLHPLRMDVLIVLDGDDRVAEYVTHTEMVKISEWQWLPW